MIQLSLRPQFKTSTTKSVHNKHIPVRHVREAIKSTIHLQSQGTSRTLWAQGGTRTRAKRGNMENEGDGSCGFKVPIILRRGIALASRQELRHRSDTRARHDPNMTTTPAGPSAAARISETRPYCGSRSSKECWAWGEFEGKKRNHTQMLRSMEIMALIERSRECEMRAPRLKRQTLILAPWSTFTFSSTFVDWIVRNQDSVLWWMSTEVCTRVSSSPFGTSA